MTTGSDNDLLDVSLLYGHKVSRLIRAKVLDRKQRTIGELTEGEFENCRGKMINYQGDVVLDSDGHLEIIGKVKLVDGVALRELIEDRKECRQAERLWVEQKEVWKGGRPIAFVASKNPEQCNGLEVFPCGIVRDKWGVSKGFIQMYPEVGSENLTDLFDEESSGASTTNEAPLKDDMPPGFDRKKASSHPPSLWTQLTFFCSRPTQPLQQRSKLLSNQRMI